MGWFILGFCVGAICCTLGALYCAKDGDVIDLGNGHAIKLEFIKKD